MSSALWLCICSVSSFFGKATSDDQSVHLFWPDWNISLAMKYIHAGVTLLGSQPSAHWSVTGSQRLAMNMMASSNSITTLIITSTFPCSQVSEKAAASQWDSLTAVCHIVSEPAWTRCLTSDHRVYAGTNMNTCCVLQQGIILPLYTAMCLFWQFHVGVIIQSDRCCCLSASTFYFPTVCLNGAVISMWFPWGGSCGLVKSGSSINDR